VNKLEHYKHELEIKEAPRRRPKTASSWGELSGLRILREHVDHRFGIADEVFASQGPRFARPPAPSKSGRCCSENSGQSRSFLRCEFFAKLSFGDFKGGEKGGGFGFAEAFRFSQFGRGLNSYSGTAARKF